MEACASSDFYMWRHASPFIDTAMVWLVHKIWCDGKFQMAMSAVGHMWVHVGYHHRICVINESPRMSVTSSSQRLRKYVND